jgi:hypothetical protein
MFIIAIVAILGIFGLISAAVASARGHSFVLFFLLGALISPVLAILLAFILQPAQGASRRVRKVRRGGSRRTGGTATARQRNRARTRAGSKNPYEPPLRY